MMSVIEFIVPVDKTGLLQAVKNRVDAQVVFDLAARTGMKREQLTTGSLAGNFPEDLEALPAGTKKAQCQRK